MYTKSHCSTHAMADKTKKKKSPGGGGVNTELINLRFYEHQKRQALTTTVEEGEEVDRNNELLSSVTTSFICDTVDEALKNPPSSSVEAVSVDIASSSSSLAISAPSDKSRKGSVDQKIWNLVNLINRENDSFFTTSSCSGRIILYTWDVTKDEEEASSVASTKLKKGCKWLLVSHDEVQPEELVNSYLAATTALKQESTLTSTGEMDVYFKMEPCILHVQCRTLSNARKLIHVATESGFRNSGMVIGKENRITVAIRSAMGLEVPLSLPVSDRLLQQTEESLGTCTVPQISGEYLKYLAETANTKMKENWSRSEKLTKLFAETSWNT